MTSTEEIFLKFLEWVKQCYDSQDRSKTTGKQLEEKKKNLD